MAGQLGFYVGLVIGAAGITGLLSRLWLWLLKRASPERTRILWAHLLSFACVNLLRLWTAPEFTTTDHIAATIWYLIFQGVWLLFDLHRLKKRGSV